MATGKFYGVGVGPGDVELITLKAVRILKTADVIFTAVSRQSARSVSGRVVDAVDGITGKRQELVFAMTKSWDDRMNLIRKNAGIILSELRQGKNCVFTTIGDPLTYSTYGYLMKELQLLAAELKIITIPGVNSWSALAAASNTILVEDKERLCIVPSYSAVAEKAALEHAETVVFLKTYNSRNNIIDKLDCADEELLYGSNLGLDEQFISTNIEQIRKRGKEYLSMLIVKKNG
ncbi:MAG: precorrin-2 C(20)-methyltransferase [Victivallaceae bacterium]|nr:precorrin-2 C(20)-methyltransferase [Victivallaceae bacterium]